jgi:hypothetical protein
MTGNDAPMADLARSLTDELDREREENDRLRQAISDVTRERDQNREQLIREQANPASRAAYENAITALKTADERDAAYAYARRCRDVLSLVELALSQHSHGPAVAAMRIAGNGPTLGEVVGRALAETFDAPLTMKIPQEKS